MINYKTQEKNNVNELTVNVSLEHNPKHYRIYWPLNHSGMFLQFMISQHKNFPRSSAAYIKLPTKNHVIYKTDEECPTLIEPIKNTNFTKWIDTGPFGEHDLKDIEIDSAEVIIVVTPEVKMAQQRNDIPTEQWENTYAKILVDLAMKDDHRNKLQFISITRLLNKNTRQEEYKNILNIIEEHPLSKFTLDNLCNEYINHVGYTDV